MGGFLVKSSGWAIGASPESTLLFFDLKILLYISSELYDIDEVNVCGFPEVPLVVPKALVEHPKMVFM